VNTQYIKGILNKPNLYPNAIINQWIVAILIFDFELVHVPGVKHKEPDELLKRRVVKSKEKGKGVEEAEK